MKQAQLGLLGILILALLAGVGTLAAAPERLAGLTPTPAPSLNGEVGNAGAFVLDNDLYLAGGWTGVSADPQDAVRRSTLDGGKPGSWTVIGSLPASARYGMGVVNVGGRAYLVGGSSGSAVMTVQSFGGSGWQPERSLPQPINYPGAAAARGRIFVAGGVPGPYADVWSAVAGPDGRLGEWEHEASLPRRMITQLAAVGDCLFVIGGRDADTHPRKEVYRATWGAAGHVTGWDDSPPDLPEARAWHAVAVRKDVIYVLGGTADGSNYTSRYFSAHVDAQCNLDGWLGGDLPDSRGRVAAVAAGDGLYWMGGQLGTVQGPWANDVWYDLPTPTPTPTLTPTPTTVPPRIELILQQRLIAPGDVLEYKILYKNAGGAAAEDVVITNVVPVGAEYQDGEGAAYDQASRTVSWTLPALPPSSLSAVAYRVHLTLFDAELKQASVEIQPPLAALAVAGSIADLQTPTPSPTPSSTPTATLTSTATATATSSPKETETPSPSPSSTLTATPILTATVTPTATSSPTKAETPTPTATLAETPSPTPTKTATPTRIATATPTFTPSHTQTSTPTATPSSTFTSSPTATSTPTPTPRAPVLIVNEGASAIWKYKGTPCPTAVSNRIVLVLFGRGLYMPLILRLKGP